MSFSPEFLQRMCEAVEPVLALAMRQFGLPAMWRARITVDTDLRGRAAGKVEVQRRWGSLITARLRLNPAAAALDWRELVTETIPHEVAHLVVMSAPRRFRQQAHGDDWRAVCQALGGRGDRCHQLPLGASRRQRLWRYQASDGSEHLLTTIRHQRLQQGGQYQIRRTGAMLDRNGFVGPAIEPAN